MAESTGISWCDATFNPWIGCTRKSPGCVHCYAETMVKGRMGRGQAWGPTGTRERTSATLWAKPLRWNRLAAEGLLPDGTPNLDGHRPRIFCASLADVFEPRPELAPWRSDLFDLIADTPNLDWLVLTKRPDFAASWLQGWYAQGIVRGQVGLLDEQTWTYRDGSDWGVLPNLWVGASIESTAYTWRADWLRRIPAVVRFISAEPLIGSLFKIEPGEATDGYCTETDASRDVDELQPRDASMAGSTPALSTPEDRGQPGIPGGVTVPAARAGRSPNPDADHVPARGARAPLDLTGIDWVIVGGESGGRDARPMHPGWAREIRDVVLYGTSTPPFRLALDLYGDPDAFERNDPKRPRLHFKQWGSWAPAIEHADVLVTLDGRSFVRMALDALDPPGTDGGMLMRFAGTNPKSGGKHLDGVEWCEFPEVGKGPGVLNRNPSEPDPSVPRVGDRS